MFVLAAAVSRTKRKFIVSSATVSPMFLARSFVREQDSPEISTRASPLLNTCKEVVLVTVVGKLFQQETQ